MFVVVFGCVVVSCGWCWLCCVVVFCREQLQLVGWLLVGGWCWLCCRVLWLVVGVGCVVLSCLVGCVGRGVGGAFRGGVGCLSGGCAVIVVVVVVVLVLVGRCLVVSVVVLVVVVVIVVIVVIVVVVLVLVLVAVWAVC